MVVMTRRSPVARSFGAVLALWFSIFTMEPAALHVCAQHSGHGVAAPAAASSASAAMPAGHMHHAAAAEHTPTHTPAPHESGAQCTCPGGCCVSSAVRVPAASDELTVEVAVPAHHPIAAVVSLVATNAEHVLPFANGPPTV